VSENGDGGEGEAPIWFINRGVVVLRPREPFTEWVLGAEEDASPLTAADVRSDSTAYLIPDFEYSSEAWAWIEENFALLFDMELSGWHPDPSAWPEDRDWEMFRGWFDVELIDTAWDLVDEPLSSDPAEDA
jgi:hypothetical protein